MTLTELKYIVAVAREKHFGRAAEACHVSQPTLSVAIKKLEEELEVKLFERSASEISVTPLGEEIIRQAQSVLEQAASKNALGPDAHPQVMRLRAIADRIIPYSFTWNPRARNWQWEINLIGSNQINAFCMPGGKIAFYTGILKQLELSDDEVAMVMGHEVAHALREHARERMGKSAATQGLTRLGGAIVSGVFGISPQITDLVAREGANLLTLKFSREDETEADLVGMELAARSGFNPQAGVTLWQKMAAANRNAPPQWLSTHPSGESRIKEIEANLPKVMPLYQRVQ